MVVTMVLSLLELDRPPLSSNPGAVFPPVELSVGELEALKGIEEAIHSIWLRHYPKVKPRKPLAAGEDLQERLRQENAEAESILEQRGHLARALYLAAEKVEPLENFSAEDRVLLRQLHDLLQRFPDAP